MSKLATVLALVFSSAVWAQTGEFWFSAGQSLLSNPGLGADTAGTSKDIQLTDGFRFGFRGGFNQGPHFGHEIQYAYNRTQLQFNDQGGVQQGMAFHQVGYNFLLYAMPEGTKVRVFGTGGVHFDRFVPPGSSLSSGGGETKFGVNYGGGVKVHLTKFYGVRFDVRRYDNPKPFGLPLAHGWLHQTEISAGVGIGF
jgi:opacity protein-like surface antigen